MNPKIAQTALLITASGVYAAAGLTLNALRSRLRTGERREERQAVIDFIMNPGEREILKETNSSEYDRIARLALGLKRKEALPLDLDRQLTELNHKARIAYERETSNVNSSSSDKEHEEAAELADTV